MNNHAAVIARGLRKSYRDVIAVDGLDLEVAEGEIFGLLGPNGAGKSTTIECLVGTRAADAGVVRVLGLDPRRDRARLFEQVAVQFQEVGYQDKLRVGELCRLTAALYSRPRDWRELLVEFGLAAKEAERISALSGGQRQRLAIVQALIADPRLVLLDELTTGLDPHARRRVWDVIRRINAAGVTVILTSHFMDEVEYLCDRIAILDAGRVVAAGTPQQLVTQVAAAGLEEAFLAYTESEEER